MTAALLAVTASMAGCAESPDDLDTTTDEASLDVTASPFPGSCHHEKFTFTAATACQNDGSVEFCVPKNATALQRYLRSLDRELRFLPSAGRAHCNVTTQLLVLYPMSAPQHCTAAGQLRLSAAGDLCRIAALTAVSQVVPTFYE